MAHDPSFDQFREVCQKITNYYVAERYPLAVEAGLTEEDVQASLKAAQQLIEKVRKGMR